VSECACAPAAVVSELWTIAGRCGFVAWVGNVALEPAGVTYRQPTLKF